MAKPERARPRGNDPTSTTYGPLAEAYDFFNRHLFDGRLPQCLLTVRNRGKALGYFSFERFGTMDGEKTHEIALNPRHIIGRTLRDTLSTLVHEMAHCQQHQQGKPSRNGYHNAEWAEMMRAVGLQPSHDGQPGGNQTGQRMTHYIIEGGRFEIACGELLATGFALRYGDIAGIGGSKAPTRIKYTCAACGLNAWGKPDIRIACVDCERLMTPESPISPGLPLAQAA